MKIHKQMRDRWDRFARLYLAERGKNVHDVTTARRAWDVARELGFMKEAYHVDARICDCHIRTALKRIFTHVTNW